MTTLDKNTEKLLAGKVSHPAEAAKTILDEALALACRKLLIFYSPESTSLLDRPDFFDYFKYGLACGVARVLAASDQRVQEVYIHEASNPDNEVAAEVPPDATVSLIVRVTTSSAALQGLIASLDRALLAGLKELNSARYAGREFVLDAIIVTEEEIALGIGYGHMLTSVFAPPLAVWRRED